MRQMSRVLVSAAVLTTLAPRLWAQGTPLQGQIGDVLLSLAQSPFLVQDDVYFTGVVQIEAGVQILVQPRPGTSQANEAYGLSDNVDVVVYGGRIVVNGNIQGQAPVVFRSAVEGQMWGGLVLIQAQAGSSISGAYVMQSSKGLVVFNSAPQVTSSVFYGNQYGILCLQGGSPQITGSSIASNAVGLAATSPDANPSVQSSQFSQNTYAVYGTAFGTINVNGTTFQGNQYDLISGSQTGTIDGCTAVFEATGAKVNPAGSALIKTPQNCMAATPAPTVQATAAPTPAPTPAPKRSVGGALFRGLVPGWGQFWQKRMEKGIIYPSVFLMDLGVAMAAKGSSNRLYQEYLSMTTTALPGSPEYQAAQAAAITKYEEADEQFQTYQAYGLAAVALYGYNIVDSVSEAMRKPKAKPAGLGKVALMGLLPGGGHFATGRYLKGGYTAAAEILGVVSLMSVRSKESTAYNLYIDYINQWNTDSYNYLGGSYGVNTTQPDRQQAYNDAKSKQIEAWYDSHQYASYNNRLVTILVMGHLFQLADGLLDAVHDQSKGGAKAWIYPEMRMAWTGLEPEYRTSLNIRF